MPSFSLHPNDRASFARLGEGMSSDLSRELPGLRSTEGEVGSEPWPQPWPSRPEVALPGPGAVPRYTHQPPCSFFMPPSAKTPVTQT